MTHTYRRPTDRPTSRDASHLKIMDKKSHSHKIYSHINTCKCIGELE